MTDWAVWLEASALGVWMRTSTWAYPAVNLAHLLGLVLLIAPMLLLDLRLLGLRRRFALADVSALLTPWVATGLALLLASGILLFAADAAPLLDNPLLPPKLLLISLGIVNALAFRWRWADSLAGWHPQPPLLARLQAGASMLLWLAAATLGRLLAYV